MSIGPTAPTVVHEGELRLPAGYHDWAHWRRNRRTEALPADATEGSVQFCGTCWGQGRIASPAANGEGMVPTLCWTCGGSGRLPAPA